MDTSPSGKNTRKEIVFWVNAGALGEFRPIDRKGFMELAALEAVSPGSWKQHHEQCKGKPTISEVMGVF